MGDAREDPEDTGPLRPPPPLPGDAHKGDAGRVLLLAGSETMPGAAVLAARAAQRAGAGLVGVGFAGTSVLRAVPVAAPEAVLVDLRDEPVASLHGVGLRERLERFAPGAVLLGPGLGTGAWTRELLELVLDAFDVPLLVDADGLNVLAGEPERLRGARGPVVTTPHPGEARRLLGRAVPRDADGRRDAARELAERTGGVVCLKGRGTVVAAPDGRLAVNATGNPGMATAGAGDVLAGLLAAWLARTDDDWTPFDAARVAVHAHGLAGDLAAARLGPRAVVASDLIDELGAAQRRLDGEG